MSTDYYTMACGKLYKQTTLEEICINLQVLLIVVVGGVLLATDCGLYLVFWFALGFSDETAAQTELKWWQGSGLVSCWNNFSNGCDSFYYCGCNIGLYDDPQEAS